MHRVQRRLPGQPPIIVKELADRIGISPYQLIYDLMDMSVFVSVSQRIEPEVAAFICKKYGFNLILTQHDDPRPVGLCAGLETVHTCLDVTLAKTWICPAKRANLAEDPKWHFSLGAARSEVGKFTLVAFLIQDDEINSFLFDNPDEPTGSTAEREYKVEEALPQKAKFATIEDLKYLGRCKPVRNLVGVKFFAHVLPKELPSATAESRQMAREMLAVIVLELCYSHDRKSTLNFLTDELAEFLYPELKGRLIN
jgi:hypothetical protein